MNKEELVSEISKKSKVTQKEANEVLSALIEARNGRNPQTGKSIKIPAKTVPVFSAGKKFKEVVNGK